MEISMAKKKRKKSGLTRSMFKTTGGHAKMKVDDKKKRTYYFRTKVKPDKATKVAKAEGPDILGAPADSIKFGKPKIKYDFYAIYDADLEMKFLRLQKKEISVLENVKGVMVGKDIMKPKKGKDVPGPSFAVDYIELFEIKQNDNAIIDGRTGGLANAMERLLKGPGKKSASTSWIKGNKISSGKMNSVEKVMKGVMKYAGKRPSGVKRVVEHTLKFKKLDGFYVPVYYVTMTAGSNKQTIKINAVNGDVSVAV
jgi:hypothetical protein